MTKLKIIKVPQRVVKAAEADLGKHQWQCEPLAVKFKSLDELEDFYKTAVSVALAVKKEIIEWKGGAGA